MKAATPQPLSLTIAPAIEVRAAKSSLPTSANTARQDAVTWKEAEDRAAHVHGVVRVLESSYDREDLEN